jgi:1-acyl-sn-glycerol-3-phosphate acyltransferase
MNTDPLLRKILTVLHKVFLAAFYLPLRAGVRMHYRFKYRIRYDVPKELRRLKPPYLVLADHVHPRDMFFNGLVLRPVIRWVAADANFRTPFMKFVMIVLAGSIAKSKNRSDMMTLSQMKFLSEMRCVIGVYQEGERSWDGVNLPPVKGTDKLIRFLKIPVVYVHLQGAYLDHPRWSWTSKGARINIRFELLIDREEVKDLPLSEISERITRAGEYDEWTHQLKAGSPLLGEDRAEHVELVCFLCPECRSVNSIVSTGNEFVCSDCGLKGSISPMGTFEWIRPPQVWPREKIIETIRDWNLWQMAHYRELLNQLGLGRNGSDDSPDAGSFLFWEDRNTVRLLRGRRMGRLDDLGVGSARLYGDRIEFESDQDNIVLPLKEVSSFSVFKQQYVEFFHNRLLHRFEFTTRSVSGYKWLLLFRMMWDSSF